MDLAQLRLWVYVPRQARIACAVGVWVPGGLVVTGLTESRTNQDATFTAQPADHGSNNPTDILSQVV